MSLLLKELLLFSNMLGIGLILVLLNTYYLVTITIFITPLKRIIPV